MATFFARRSRTRFLLCALGALSGAWSGAARAAFDTPDTGFGSGGLASFNVGTPVNSQTLQSAVDATVDSQGRVYALDVASGPSQSTKNGITRLNADGTVDASFGTGGFMALEPAIIGGAPYPYTLIGMRRDLPSLYLAASNGSGKIALRRITPGELPAECDNAVKTSGPGPCATLDGLDERNLAVAMGPLRFIKLGSLLVTRDERFFITGVVSRGVCCDNPAGDPNGDVRAFVLRVRWYTAEDGSYGSGGMGFGPLMAQAVASDTQAYRGLIDAAGRVLVPISWNAGSAQRAGVLRFATDGKFDRSILLPADGGAHTFLAGRARNDGSLYLLTRSDATLPATLAINAYNDDGGVKSDFGSNGVQAVSYTPLLNPQALAPPLPLADGKVLFAGSSGASPTLAAVERSEGAPLLAGQLPETPTSFVGTPGSSGPQLIWNLAAGASEYTIYAGTAPGALDLGATMHGLEGPGAAPNSFEAGTRYYFTVRAENQYGSSGDSNEISVIPMRGLSEIAATPGDKSATVAWVADELIGVDSYNLYMNLSQPVSQVLVQSGISADTTSVTVPGLSNGTIYRFTLKMVNDTGEGFGIDTAGVVPHVAPTGLAATPGENRVTLTWTPGEGSTYFNIYSSSSADDPSPTLAKVIPGNISSTIITGLSGGTEYFFTVKGDTLGQPTAPTNKASATPTGLPIDDGHSGDGGALPLASLLMLLAGAGLRRCLH